MTTLRREPPGRPFAQAANGQKHDRSKMRKIVSKGVTCPCGETGFRVGLPRPPALVPVGPSLAGDGEPMSPSAPETSGTAKTIGSLLGLGSFLARPGSGAPRKGSAGAVVGEAFDQAEDQAPEAFEDLLADQSGEHPGNDADRREQELHCGPPSFPSR